jgi:hypothetical protein
VTYYNDVANPSLMFGTGAIPAPVTAGPTNSVEKVALCSSKSKGGHTYGGMGIPHSKNNKLVNGFER